jgi:hypothetical protein
MLCDLLMKYKMRLKRRKTCLEKNAEAGLDISYDIEDEKMVWIYQN